MDHPPSETTLPYDGGNIHYLLEGPADAENPVIVFSNELVTSMHLWDAAVALLKERYPTYRFLRYDTRGYHEDFLGSTQNITLDILSDDIANLLSMLNIPKVHSVIGAGLGGLTALAFASRYPDRLERFVGIGFNIISSQQSKRVWTDRLRYARGYPMHEILASKAVANWFTEDSRGKPIWESGRAMVGAASSEGMQRCVNAVYDYDQTRNLRSIQVPSLFLCGAGDYDLPEEMMTFPEKMAPGLGRYKEIERSRSLAELENPQSFVNALQVFFTETMTTEIS